jgi:hypothetical protein
VEDAHERLRVWTADGTWEAILDEVIVKDDSVGNVEWTVSEALPTWWTGRSAVVRRGVTANG